ncbi:general odorant-binding protein 99a-like [Episyrphus balteatus]|uniref:general odorant-binding protein 99a-like n=1 Tax=Episyrphus balteatus TaxID=286459 RepID=UPI00248597E6|nr:general odorant-binding protein 99a-like [Episyrphus balteatus]
MKIYIILALVALTSAEWKPKSHEEWLEIEAKCKEQRKMTPELEERIKNEPYLPKEAFEFHLCCLRSTDLWSDSEGFSLEGMTAILDRIPDEEKIDKDAQRDILKKCIDNNSEGSTPFDWAYRCYKCFKDNGDFLKNIGKAKFHDHKEH